MAARAKDERAPDMAGFREVQRLAYACAEAVAARLVPGVTEREAARMQRDWLRERGVCDWFHLPFAWFGDRTAFTGFKVPLQFFPTHRRLEPGMPFILDMAPVYKGFTADIGYSGHLGHNPPHERLLADLEAHRELILREVRERRPLRGTYEDVERLMARQGYATGTAPIRSASSPTRWTAWRNGRGHPACSGSAHSPSRGC